MRVFSTFTGIGGFEVGIRNAYRTALGREQADTPESAKALTIPEGRYSLTLREYYEQNVCEFFDVTADLQRGAIWGMVYRGFEIKEWLDRHPGARRYAILDDTDDFLWGQHLFRTTWAEGLTDEIADQVIAHLNG